MAKMIIPTADFDPLFAHDGTPFREKMLAHIQREFADLLGGRAQLLEGKDGLLKEVRGVEQNATDERTAA